MQARTIVSYRQYILNVQAQLECRIIVMERSDRKDKIKIRFFVMFYMSTDIRYQFLKVIRLYCTYGIVIQYQVHIFE